MLLRSIQWLWSNSRSVCTGAGVLAHARRLRFCLRAVPVFDLVDQMINAPSASALGRLMKSRPETVGAIIWPYQCLGWDARTRLARIIDHYSVLDQIGG